MVSIDQNPRVLIVTPEVAYLPHGSDYAASYLSAGARGIFAAHFIRPGSLCCLKEVAGGRYGFLPQHVQDELTGKIKAGCAVGMLDAPDPLIL